MIMESALKLNGFSVATENVACTDTIECSKYANDEKKKHRQTVSDERQHAECEAVRLPSFVQRGIALHSGKQNSDSQPIRCKKIM